MLKSPSSLTGGGFQHKLVGINHVSVQPVPEIAYLLGNQNPFYAAMLARALRLT
jgi:hypothetical protein